MYSFQILSDIILVMHSSSPRAKQKAWL